jgi:hypothetical protein
MNPRQKHYESYDKTTKLLKLTNSYYHFRNLEYIKNRKSRYDLKPLSLSPYKNHRAFNIFQFYDIKKQNKNIKNKIKKILLKPIKPNMNDNFIEKDKKLKIFRKLQNDYRNKKIDRANEYFKKRIRNQKAFINPKMMDKIYDIEHSKSLMKLRKIRGNENYILPPIKTTNDNMSFLDFVKYFNVESSRYEKNDESKINNIKQVNYSSLSNTYYDNNKDSGTSSINK